LVQKMTLHCGPGNMRKLVAPLNKGDAARTARNFSLYTRAQGIQLPGLVQRRARETALFLKPAEAPAEPSMPQTIDPARASTQKT
jgi:GH24 family phage-related lysozyme (muramidase)